MYTTTSSALPRFLVAVLTVLFIGACDILNAPPDDLEPTPFTKCLRSVEPPEAQEASNSEIRLACLIKTHPEQQREEMNYHPILGKVARERAEDMAENGYYGGEDYGLPYPPHVDHDGFGPNYYICKAGYIIDPWICEEAEEDPFINTVESIGWGSGSSRSSPQDQLNGWLNSPGHRRHVLATSGPHEVASTNYGIGHAATGDSPDRPGRSASFWVFIAAPPPESSE